MTSESGVERDALPEDDTRAHPTQSQFEADGDTIAGLSKQIAELIKERDDAQENVGLLKRTLIQMTATVTQAEVDKLEAELELAKVRAAEARKLARQSGSPIAVFSLALGGKKAEANGQDA